MSTGIDIFLVLLAQSGDRNALDQLFQMIQGHLFLRVSAIVGHRETAEDVLQDVFVLLQRKLRHLRDPRYFRAWAVRIAVREAVRRAQKERDDARTLATEAELAQIGDPNAPDPIQSLVGAEVAELVRDLPAASRVVLTLHYLDDLPLAEVAQVLEIPIGTVKSRLAYGLGVLRHRLRVERA